MADEDKKRGILLSVCGLQTYRIARNLSAPTPLEEQPYDELVKLVGAYHNPKPSAIFQRYKFNTRCREAGESVATFVANISKLVEHCEFGESMIDMLRDRLVCGINNDRSRELCWLKQRYYSILHSRKHGLRRQLPRMPRKSRCP